MDGDYAPGALDAELFEESCCYYCVGGCICIWIEQGATNDTDEDDGESTTEDLRAVTDYGTACHGAEVGYDLCYGYGVGGEFVLVG